MYVGCMPTPFLPADINMRVRFRFDHFLKQINKQFSHNVNVNRSSDWGKSDCLHLNWQLLRIAFFFIFARIIKCGIRYHWKFPKFIFNHFGVLETIDLREKNAKMKKNYDLKLRYLNNFAGIDCAFLNKECEQSVKAFLLLNAKRQRAFNIHLDLFELAHDAYNVSFFRPLLNSASFSNVIKVSVEWKLEKIEYVIILWD